MTTFETKALKFLAKICIPLARFSFFVVYFGFGLLKVLGLSPAEGLVQELWSMTVSFIPFHGFMLFFAFYEMAIGIAFLFPGLERLALYLLLPHMITTFGPLVLLPEYTWKAFLVPTLAGHYIIKNLILIALGIALAAYVGNFGNRSEQKENAIPR
ncbi:MAG: hypothetical protein WBB36_01680 [Chitinophagales bacterium]